jgi:hypothetical protein
MCWQRASSSSACARVTEELASSRRFDRPSARVGPAARRRPHSAATASSSAAETTYLVDEADRRGLLRVDQVAEERQFLGLNHALGAFYRRLAARIGKAEAITATARKLVIRVYRMLRYRLTYRDLSTADYDQLQRSRILRGLRKRAASLGFDLVDIGTGVVT